MPRDITRTHTRGVAPYATRVTVPALVQVQVPEIAEHDRRWNTRFSALPCPDDHEEPFVVWLMEHRRGRCIDDDDEPLLWKVDQTATEIELYVRLCQTLRDTTKLRFVKALDNSLVNPICVR